MQPNYLPGAWAHECWRRNVLPELLKLPYRRSFSWEKKEFLNLSSKVKLLFIDIEDLCNSRGWLVLEYIRDAPLYASIEMSQFSHYQYLDADIISCYDGAVKTNNPRYSWTTQIQSLVSRARRLVPCRYRTVNELLYDIHQPFSAWFRVLYPRELDNQLVDMYGNEARQEIFSDLILKDFLTQIYPLADITRLGISI